MAADLLEQSRRILEGVDDIERGDPFRPTNELLRGGRRRRRGVVVRQRGGVRAPTTAWCSSTPAARSLARRCTTRSAAWTPDRLAHRRVHPRPHRPRLRRAVFDEESAERAGRARAWSPTRRCPAASTATCLTAGYNGVINQRQFQLPALRWPTEYRYPDETYRDRARPRRRRRAPSSCTTPAARPTTTPGSWVPRARVLCTGDLFIWASPNAGNPQKVQRYPREWAAALRGDGRAGRRGAAARATACRSSARTAIAQALDRHRRRCSSRSSTRRSR